MHQQPIPTTSPAEPDTTERTFRLTTALPGYRPLVLTCALADLPNRVREAFDPAGTGTEVEVSADGSTATVLNPDGSTGFVFAVTVEPAPAPVQPTTPHHTSPLTIAAALRRAAADLENLGDIPISSTQVSIDLQAVAHVGTFDERRSTVDVLARALTGDAGKTAKGRDAHHTTKPFVPRLGVNDVQVAVFTAVKDFRPG
ncbi:hypothetical protein [Micromonospora echinospora]